MHASVSVFAFVSELESGLINHVLELHISLINLLLCLYRNCSIARVKAR